MMGTGEEALKGRRKCFERSVRGWGEENWYGSERYEALYAGLQIRQDTFFKKIPRTLPTTHMSAAWGQRAFQLGELLELREILDPHTYHVPLM